MRQRTLAPGARNGALIAQAGIYLLYLEGSRP